MTSSGEELEVKFFSPDLAKIAERLQVSPAKLVQPRQYEVNLRFDTASGELLRQRQVLRLRQDDAARLTFKGPGREVDGIQQRQELEVTVSDFSMAQRLLEALGYQVIWMYEKYRQTFALGKVLVTLDELPFGSFIEIEGPDGDSIQRAARQLGLNWDQRILVSYAALFEQARQALGFTFRDLSFDNFKDLAVPADVFTMHHT